MARRGLQQVLRQQRVRMTPQRECLIALIEDADKHIDARTLLETGRERFPKLNKTTVYRTLNLLKARGLVDELDLLHHEARGHYYEPVPERQELHLVCLRCGKVMESCTDTWEKLTEEAAAEHDFEITTARVEIGGYCRSCR